MSLTEDLNKFTNIIQDWEKNIGDIFFSNEAKDVDIKVLDADGNETTVTIKNRQSILNDNENFKNNLNLKNENGVLKDNNGNPMSIDKLGGKTITDLENNYGMAKRLLVNPTMKQGNGVGLQTIIFQSKDLKHIIGTGRNYNNGFAYYTSEDLDTFLTYPNPNPKVKVKKVLFCGADTQLLLFEDGKLYGWGRNNKGQLGLGNTNTILYPTYITDNVLDIESNNQGDNYNDGSLYVIKTDGTLWVAGSNDDGELGVGDTDDRITLTKSYDNTDNGEKVIKVLCSGTNGNTAVILTDAGNVYTAGYNNNGQVGNGTTDTQKSWYSPSINDDYNFIDVAITTMCDSIYDVSTAILTDNGKLFTTGDNSAGQIGNNSTDDVHSFTEADYPNSYDADNDPFIKIFGGSIRYFMALTRNGDLYVVGDNGYGQLGLGDTDNRKQYTLSLSNVTNVWLRYGVDSDNRAAIVRTVDDNGNVKFYGAGRNQYGALGVGHNSDISSWQEIKLVEPENVIDVHQANNESRHTTYFIYNDGTVMSCGDSYYGQTSLYGYSRDTSTVVPRLFN